MSRLAHTYTSKSFRAKIVPDGIGNKLEMESEAWWQDSLNKFKPGTPITITLTDKRPKRTQEQNSYYWVYLTLISEKSGNDIDDLHTLFKGLFLSKGVVEVLGHKVRKAKSTTELSINQFSEYIRRIEVLTGVMAPPTIRRK